MASPLKQTEKQFITANDMKHLQADLTAFCETTIYSSHALMGSDINYSPSLSARENPDRAEHRVCGGGVLEPKAVRRQGSRTHAHTHTNRGP